MVTDGLVVTMQTARPNPNNTRKSMGIWVSENGGARANIGAMRRLSRRLEKSQPMGREAPTLAQLSEGMSLMTLIANSVILWIIQGPSAISTNTATASLGT